MYITAVCFHMFEKKVKRHIAIEDDTVINVPFPIARLKANGH